MRAVRVSLAGHAVLRDSATLLDAAVGLIMTALALTTMTNYESAQKSYFGFAVGHGIRESEMFPPSEGTLIAFATYLFLMEGRTHGAIQRVLYATKSLCKFLGMSMAAFSSSQLELLLRSIKKKRGPKRRPKRMPITVPILAEMIEELASNARTRDPETKSAALAIGVYGLMRAGEFTYKKLKDREGYILRRADVCWHSHKVIITLRESKTDIFRQGVDISLFKNSSRTCPYRLLKRAWDGATDKRPSAPLLQNGDGSPFTYKALHSMMKSVCRALGYSGTIGTHSLRIGGATTLAMLGYPAHVIRTMGRWKSISYQLYIRLMEADFVNVSNKFGSMARAGKGKVFSPSAFGGISTDKAADVSFENIDTVFHSR
jgi:hypothetical protein